MKVTTLLPILFASSILNFQPCESYRILGLFPVNTKSHFIMFEALMKGLVRKGHHVDVISTFPLKTPYPNYTDIIVLPPLLPIAVNNVSYDIFQEASTDTISFIANIGNTACENLGHPEMREFMRNSPKNPPYDLFITEFFATQCFLAIGHLLKIPMIGVSSVPLYPWLNLVIANPSNFAFVPNNLFSYVAPMNFWQRFSNTVHSIYCHLYFRYLTREQDNMIKKNVGEFVPGVQEMESNLSLVLVNSHVSVNGARPMASVLIEVGGLHIEDNDEQLSKDLEEWMDSSEAGFIYFTFGSMLTIESFPERIIQAVYKSSRKIAPVRVLVKIADRKKLPPGLPKNIHTFQWAPQLKVLSHRNVKAFVTHGGLMGTQEAIYCAVPMIGIPLFFDQFVNVDLYVQKKIAVKLNYQTLTAETLEYALKEILHNPIYKESIAKISKQFRDRPMSAMDTATWWVEYIARNGSTALRSPALELAWWQIELLDVSLFLLLITAVVTFLAITFVRLVIKIYVAMISPEIVITKKLD